eukprot:GILK01008354.1.p1 GENE.GILK01008354.1~~GILK01008354.1.p1  ORF type:complete len:244 (+),score=75.51 GILK01008354.1:52-732(+)
MAEDDWTLWLREGLAKFSLDDDVYVEYIEGIMGDNDLTKDEREETIVEYLSAVGSADEESMNTFTKDLATHWQRKQQSQAEAHTRALEDKRRKDEEERERAMQEAIQMAAQRSNQVKEESREDKRLRERLVAEYGVSIIDEFDEEGNIVFTKAAAKKKDAESASPSHDISGNDNRAAVARADAAFREMSKMTHETEMRKIKEQQEKERMKKEKEKQRVSKKERRRG